MVTPSVPTIHVLDTDLNVTTVIFPTPLPIDYLAYTEEYGDTHPAYVFVSQREEEDFAPYGARSDILANAGSEMLQMVPGLLTLMGR